MTNNDLNTKILRIYVTPAQLEALRLVAKERADRYQLPSLSRLAKDALIAHYQTFAEASKTEEGK